MCTKLSFSLTLIIIHAYFTFEPFKVTGQELDKNINDTILELFNDCSCMPYFLCAQVNVYATAARAEVIPKEILCSDTQFACCKNVTDPNPVTTEATTPKTTTPTVEAATKATTKTPEVTIPPVTSLPTTRNTNISQSCGIAKTLINTRILTSDDESAFTIPGEMPWIVEIFQKRDNAEQPYRLKCVGSLIHPRVVLTATHCIVSIVSKPETLKVIATGKDTFQPLTTNPQDERGVAKIIKHPKYNSGGLYNDVALLILDREYSFSDNFLNAVCLPKPNESFDGKKCLAAGWGDNPSLEILPLKKVDVPIVEAAKCQDLLRKTKLGENFSLDPSFVCAGGEEGKDTCKGDGGGPLVCLGENFQFVQTGIVSWGVDCGVVDRPGLYANVGLFAEWIKGELEKNDVQLSWF